MEDRLQAGSPAAAAALPPAVGRVARWVVWAMTALLAALAVTRLVRPAGAVPWDSAGTRLGLGTAVGLLLAAMALPWAGGPGGRGRRVARGAIATVVVLIGGSAFFAPGPAHDPWVSLLSGLSLIVVGATLALADVRTAAGRRPCEPLAGLLLLFVLLTALGRWYGGTRFVWPDGPYWMSGAAMVGFGAFALGVLALRPAEGEVGKMLRPGVAGTFARGVIPATLLLLLALAYLARRAASAGWIDARLEPAVFAAGAIALLTVLMVRATSWLARGEARRERALAALRQRSAEVAEKGELLEQNHEAMFTWELDGGITFWNTGAELLYGYRREEVLGRPSHVLLGTEEARASGSGFLDELRRSGRWRGELRHRRKDDQEIVVESSMAIFQRPDGRRVVLESNRDMTARRAAEEALRGTTSMLAVIAEHSPDPIFLKDLEGRFLFANPATLRAFRRPAKDVIGRRTDEILPDSAASRAIDANDRQALQSPVPVVAEEMLRDDQGHERVYLVTKAAWRDAAGELCGLVGIARDISARKTAEQALRRARVELEEHSQALEARVEARTAELRDSLATTEELLYTIAHDLRAPNRAIEGFAQLLLKGQGGALGPVASDYLQRIARNATRANDLIRDLLAYGRVSHDELPLGPLDLGRVTRTVVAHLRNTIEQRQATVQLGARWPRVFGNETLLGQVVENLILNALTYVPADRKPQVTVRAEEHDDAVVLEVADNGIGVPPAMRERIFLPFTRVQEETFGGGTGMGLAIVRKAVGRMRGEVTVEPAPHGGSRFLVRLRPGAG